MPFDFVRLLLCYRVEKESEGRREVCLFQNEYNKVEIAIRVVQFWSEIKLVIKPRLHGRFFAAILHVISSFER